METLSLAPGLSALLEQDVLSLSGDLDRHNGVVLLHWLEALPVISRLDLAELDIVDGVAATHAVNAVRMLHSRASFLCIEHAPQVLAHNLYRTGLLMDDGIVLEAMREDEAYG